MKAAVHMPLIAVVLVCLAACTERPRGQAAKPQAGDIDDPVESANRDFFAVNQFADHNVMKPVAVAYRDNVPDGVQRGVHNVLTNLREPVVSFNDLLQGNIRRAWTSLSRFIVNTTIGGLGIFDVASKWDMPHHDADFGQTFGVWGIDTGPYVELPFLGPSDLRDAVGAAVGIVLDPFFFAGGSAVITYVGAARSGTSVLDERARYIEALDAIESTSIDYYAAMRSLYLQRRQAVVEEGKHPDERRAGHIDVRFNTPSTPDPTMPATPASPFDETAPAK
ncbi:MAG: VacJ family lipoprotein [Alphaproteobacteria bacterium]